MRPATVTLAAGLLSLMLGGPAAAQTVATSFEELRGILTRGQKVIVIGPDGKAVRGRVDDVAVDAFVLKTGDWRDGGADQRRRTFTEGPLTARQRTDRLINGMLIGLAVGAIAGGAVMAEQCDGGNDCSSYGGGFGMFVIGAGVFGGIGAGVGTVIDLATPHKEIVVEYRWQPSRSRTLTLGPRIDRSSVRMAATLGF